MGNIWAAVRYDGGDIKFRYRCLMTRLDQQNPDNLQIWGEKNRVDLDGNILSLFYYRPPRGFLIKLPMKE
jgi:hypothetical protein